MFKQLQKSLAAQTFIEYTILFGVVIAIMIAMTPMIRRGVQSVVKTVADEVGTQQNSEQRLSLSGHMVSSNTLISADRRDTTTDQWGTMTYSPDHRTRTGSRVLTNLGFTETP